MNEQYAGVELVTLKEGNRILIDSILSGTPFLAARVGGTEINTIRVYDRPIKYCREMRIYSNTICELSGFFPKNPIQIRKFCSMYKAAMQSIDYYGKFRWQNEEEYVSKIKGLKKCYPAELYDVLLDDVYWCSALEGKKVLIIHPFAQTIYEQYTTKREKLFPKDSNILPEFEMIAYKSIQSLGGRGAEGYDSWFMALEKMKHEVSLINFDIALLACGAYGVPLAAFIKSIGKQAIYMGGCLQLMFGIMGKRWEKADFVLKYVNEYWTRPSAEEKGDWASKVEDGCYW